jgi:hypothetical protein
MWPYRIIESDPHMAPSVKGLDILLEYNPQRNNTKAINSQKVKANDNLSVTKKLLMEYFFCLFYPVAEVSMKSGKT